MKSFIKKVMVIAVVLASITDWPVETKAINGKTIEKAASLLEGCSKSTKKVEEFVNKATQETKKTVNEAAQTTKETVNKAAENAAENPAVVYGSARTLPRAIQSNAQTTSQPRMVICSRCYGRGSVQGNDGYVYSCSRCNGTGKIFTK